jgi:putative ABC transport system ATP-binding protein
VLQLLDQLNEHEKMTIVMVTHDPRAAARAHTRLFLEKGELARREEAVP